MIKLLLKLNTRPQYKPQVYIKQPTVYIYIKKIASILLNQEQEQRQKKNRYRYKVDEKFHRS